MFALALFAGAPIALSAPAFRQAPGLGQLQHDPRSPAAAFARLVEASRAGDTLQTDSAVALLAEFTRADVRAVVESALALDRGEDSPRAGLVFLERLGRADDLPLTVLLARTGLEAELERSILSVARRDTRALAVLDGLVRTAPTDVRRAFVRAVELLDTLPAVAWIARCAERAPDVRSEAIARLGRLAESLPHPAPEEALSLIHGILAGYASDGFRDAVIAAGRMEDGDAIPYLIALLSEDDAGLRSDAAWALERITGLRLRERRERWEDWYATELTWWRDRSEAAFAELAGFDRSARTCVLLEISSLHASRDRLSLAVAPLLQDPDAELARLAAQVLRVLHSKVAAADLAEALRRPEPEIVHEAWRALRAITRKDLPADPDAWLALITG